MGLFPRARITVPAKPDSPERPDCFGLGRDLNSRQWVPIERCQECPHVTACALLRLARQAESGGMVRRDTH